MVFLSKDETSTDSEFVKITSSGTGSSLRDVVTVADYKEGWAKLNRKIGEGIPVVNSGTKNYSYRIASTGAASADTIDPSKWSLDRKNTIRSSDKLVLTLTRSKDQPGIAEVAPGNSVKARIFVSPAKSISIYNSFDVEPSWSREFSGTGQGSIPGKKAQLKNLDAARISMTLSTTLLGATILAFIAF